MGQEFLRSSELNDFQRTVRGILEKESASRTKSGAGRQTWNALVESGALLAAAPESVGGLGLGCLAAEMLAFESGRALAPAPLWETVAFAILPLSRILDSDSKVAAELQQIVEGGLACSGSISSFPVPVHDISAKFFFVRENGKAASIFSLPREVVEKPPKRESLDLVRSFANLSANDGLIGKSGERICELSQEQFARLKAEFSIMLASEITGAAERAVEMTVEYAKTRQQFGQAIGAFQSVAHQLADMHLAVEASSSLCRFAAWAADNDPSQLQESALGAITFAVNSLPKVVEQAIQLHGGIGFTYEYELHLFLRRVRNAALIFAPVSSTESILADQILAAR